MIKWCVVALGALMVAWGVSSAWSAWDIVQVERGWSMVIAGIGAATGGAIVLAIGGLIGRIDALQRAFLSNPRTIAEEDLPLPPIPLAVRPAAAPQVASPPAISALAPASAAGEPSVDDTRPDGPAPSVTPPAARPVPRPTLPKADRPLRKMTVLDRLRGNSPAVEPPAPPPAPAAERAIISRHSIKGIDFVHFDDGSIEADTPSGHLRFQSVAELKTFVENYQPDPAI